MSTPVDTPLIELKSVSKRFGRVAALDAVDLGLRAGESVAVFGPNGAGKTTLLRIIAGLIKPTSGGLFLDGEDLTHGHHDEARKRIGYISHQGLVYPELTARENLSFYGKLYNIGNAPERAESLLNDVGLKTRADDAVATYSRGMKQRLSIARALINDPDIILLDEPFTGLDQHAAEMLVNLLIRLHGERRTIVMITHNLKIGLDVSSRALIQAGGKIRFDKPVSQIDRAGFHDLYINVVGGAHY